MNEDELDLPEKQPWDTQEICAPLAVFCGFMRKMTRLPGILNGSAAVAKWQESHLQMWKSNLRTGILPDTARPLNSMDPERKLENLNLGEFS